MSKVLVVIDMQNDFVTGSLANESAKEIVNVIANEMQLGGYAHAVFTRDTHTENYLNTPEGQSLPVKHCIKGTEGWQVIPDFVGAANWRMCSYFDKPTFGSIGLLSYIQSCGDFDEVVLCGTCTDICVISNALILKTMKPDLKITVLGYACAGVTPEKHNAALDVMESCQINVVRTWEDKYGKLENE